MFNRAFRWIALVSLFSSFSLVAEARFLQTDPIGYEDQMNLYGYAGNDPINATDPTGEYGRGSGFSDKEWKKFDRAQQKAAKKADKAAGKLRSAAGKKRNGGKLSGSEKRTIKKFEKKIGGEASADRLDQVAVNLEDSATALSDDGSRGYTANAETSSQWSAAGYSPDAAARAVRGGSTITINLGHSARYQGRILNHEALHNVGGFGDQRLNGYTAYKAGDANQRRALKQLPHQRPDLAIRNPDSILGLVYP